jgi:hypothetical protein
MILLLVPGIIRALDVTAVRPARVEPASGFGSQGR